MTRILRKEVEVAASASTVWDLWTSERGVRSFFAPEALIEPRPSGRYELYFVPDASEDQKGSEGCRIVSLMAGIEVTFTWNFPPTLPSIRDEHTVVRVAMTPIGPRHSRVTLEQTGWGDGGDWDEGFAYFERAWALVLGRLQWRVSHGPLDWDEPYTPDVAEGGT